jgi:hypothetical protein
VLDEAPLFADRRDIGAATEHEDHPACPSKRQLPGSGSPSSQPSTSRYEASTDRDREARARDEIQTIPRSHSHSTMPRLRDRVIRHRRTDSAGIHDQESEPSIGTGGPDPGARRNQGRPGGRRALCSRSCAVRIWRRCGHGPARSPATISPDAWAKSTVGAQPQAWARSARIRPVQAGASSHTGSTPRAPVTTSK